MQLKSFKDLRISLKLGLFLLLVALIAATNYAGVIYFANIQKNDAAVVDAAGRNRMLSQRIAFFCERAAREHPVKEDLKSAVELLNTSIIALKHGGVAPGIADNRLLPPTSQHILPTFVGAEELWSHYKESAEIVLDNPAMTDTLLVQSDSSYSTMTMQVANPKVAKALLFVEQNAGTLLVKLNDLVKMYVQEADQKQGLLKSFLLIMFLLSVAIVTLGIYATNRYISRPIKRISDSSGSLAQGNLHLAYIYDSADEIGKAYVNLKNMAGNLERAANFAERIGQGVFDSEYKTVSKDDKLGIALITMRDKLLNIHKEEKKRIWATEGLAKFAEILRNDQHDLKKLSDVILSNLVKYLNANQGGIFIVNDDNPNDEHLELMAAYAWDKKRFVQKRFEKQEGLVGQAWLEGETIYMKAVPENYVAITSGLGQATPRCIMMTPLKVNGNIFGIIELASFHEYETFEREFVSKLSETIAAAISIVKVNERTRKLLEQSQQQAEELRAQEEEMRQNIEEIQATQEEVARKEREYQIKIEQLEAELKTKHAKDISLA